MAAATIGMKILQVLQKLYGKEFVSKTIGTRANVVKPKELDTNAPTKNLYSKEAFRDQKLQSIIDSKISEYAPYIYSSKNRREQMNYLENAEQLLAQKKRDFGVTENMTKVREVKPEADVIDIKTGKKAEGIETLKEDLGLPPEVNPRSEKGKILQEMKRLDKEKGNLEQEMYDDIDKAMESFFSGRNASKDVLQEGKRRAVIRKILLKDDRISLPDDVRKSLENYDDLRGGGTQEMDPLTIFDTYYKRDNTKFGKLDDIIDFAENEFKASDEFLKDDQFDLIDDVKPPRDEKAGGGLSYLMGI